MNVDEQRPAVCIRAHEQVGEDRLDSLRFGMEEEGVPSQLSLHRELDPLVLAHEASQQSRLGVGVGVSLDYVVITTDKLPAGRPYIAVQLGRDADRVRSLGANAARLVKRTPLLPLTKN